MLTERLQMMLGGYMRVQPVSSATRLVWPNAGVFYGLAGSIIRTREKAAYGSVKLTSAGCDIVRSVSGDDRSCGKPVFTSPFPS